MANEGDGKPATFRADRWRFAREKTGERLMPALKSYAANITLATSALVTGTAVSGISHFLAELEPFVATVLVFTAILVVSFVVTVAILLFNYLVAPAAMCQRDQRTIDQLRQRLRPAISLSFSEDECIRELREGTLSESDGGQQGCSVLAGEQGAERRLGC